MGTRCFISLRENGRIVGVTCHYDGYIECAGMTLFLGFSDKDLLRRLIGHGDMSSLGTAISNTAFIGDGSCGAREYLDPEDVFQSEPVEYAYVLDEERGWEYYKKGEKEARELEPDLRACCPGVFQISRA